MASRLNEWGLDGPENDKIVPDGPLEASNWHARRFDDHSDIMTDYFAGCHFDNVTQLINFVKPPECKFAVGQLVRGKQNKRAVRSMYARRIAMVTKTAGNSFWLDFVDGNNIPYGPSYPTRDFEKIQ